MLSAEERRALSAAQRQSRSVRHWRGDQAIGLRSEGLLVNQVAQALGCIQTSVDHWTAAYRREGASG